MPQTITEKEATGADSSKFWIVALAVAAAALIIWLNLQKSPVEPRPGPEPTLATVDYTTDVQRLVLRAADADQTALARFEQSLATAMENYAAESLVAAENAAASVSTYDSIIHVISYLAWDQIKGTDEAGAYLRGQVNPRLTPPVVGLAEDLNSATSELDYELKKISVQLAVDLAALGPNTVGQPRKFEMSGDVQQDFDKTLRNLGISAAVVGVSAVVDIYAIANTTVVKTLVRSLASMAAKLFGKQVAKAVVVLTAPMADGPLPVGDVVAIVFGLWTAYEIYQLQPQFHESVKTASVNQLREIGGYVKSTANQNAGRRVGSFQNVQARIGASSLKQLSLQAGESS